MRWKQPCSGSGILRTQRIGDYLAENEIVSREQLAQAIRHQESQPILRLGEALLQLDLLTQEQLDAALVKQQQNRKLPLGQILVDMGAVDERTLKGVLAKKLGIPYVSLSKFNFDPNAIRLVAASVARKHVLMPMCFQDNALVVAFENPLKHAGDRRAALHDAEDDRARDGCAPGDYCSGRRVLRGSWLVRPAQGNVRRAREPT